VDVDPDTGQVKVDTSSPSSTSHYRHPTAHQGQLDGGLFSATARRWTEELIHEEGADRHSSLGEYKLPTQMDVPPFARCCCQPRWPGPFRRQSAGENTNTAVGGAIANAIYDAVGVQIDESRSPAERVHAGLRNQANGA